MQENLVSGEPNSKIKVENNIELFLDVEDEKVPNEKLNYLAKCKCFVKKSDASTQCNFYENPNPIDCTILEMGIDVKSDESNDEVYFRPDSSKVFCVPFEPLNQELEVDLDNFETNTSNDDIKGEEDMLIDNLEYNIEDDDDAGNQSQTLDDLFFDMKPKEANCTKIDDFNYSCNICGKIFETVQNFMIHYQIHQQSSTLCAGCGFYCSNIKTFRFHLYKYRKYGDCETAKTITKLEKKMKAINDSNDSTRVRRPNFAERKCNICGREFKTGIKLQDHLNVHTRARPYICACGSCFGTHENFYSHLNQFKCPTEGRIVPNYANESLLHFIPQKEKIRGRRRRKLAENGPHEPETPNFLDHREVFLSDNSSFAQQNNEILIDYQSEDQKQSVEINYDQILNQKCKVKELKIKEPRTLKDKEIRRYICEDCSEEFATAPKLRIHKEREHMERKYSCSECSRKFAKDCLLRAHVKLYHIKNKKCIECNLTFTNVKYKNHLNVYHKEKLPPKLPKPTNRMIDIGKDDSTYNCSICSLNYSVKAYSKHFENRLHLNAETKWKKEYRIKKFYCRICDAEPNGYKTIGAFLKHKVIFHGWPLRRNLQNLIKSFEDIKPNEECSRIEETNQMEGAAPVNL